MVVSQKRGRAVHGGHHGLETAALKFVSRYLAHRRGGAAGTAAGTAGTAAAGRAHGRLTVTARRRRRRVSAAAPGVAAAATTSAAAAGRSVRDEPRVHNVPGGFPATKQTYSNHHFFFFYISLEAFLF